MVWEPHVKRKPWLQALFKQGHHILYVLPATSYSTTSEECSCFIGYAGVLRAK